MDRHTLRAWAVAILVAVVVIVSLQNSQEVRVDMLFVTIDAPLIVTLLGTVLIGIVIGYIAPVIHRNRHDHSDGGS